MPAFTIDQVVRCLTLLSFDKHVEDFRREDVNWKLLVDKGRYMLELDFGFRLTDAVKLVKFATSGWRGSKYWLVDDAIKPFNSF